MLAMRLKNYFVNKRNAFMNPGELMALTDLKIT